MKIRALPRSKMKNNVVIALGLGFGVALGAAIGAALHHSGPGVAIGGAFGLLIGAVINSRKKISD
jgi:hypothetical protein